MPADDLPEGTDTIIEGAGVGAQDEADADAVDAAAAALDVPGPAPVPAADARPDAQAAEPVSLAGRIDGLKGQAGDRAREFVEGVRGRAAGGIDDVARMIEDAAAEVDAKVGQGYGDYVRRAAASVSGMSDAIKAKDVDALFADARAFVQRAPGVTAGVAAALGFVVARLARAGLGEAAGATDPADRKAA